MFSITFNNISVISWQLVFFWRTRRKEEVRVMVLNTTFKNISIISWQSVFLVEETLGPGEYHQPASSH